MLTRINRIYLGGDNANGGHRFPHKAIVQALEACGIEGATLLPADGVWKGKHEFSWVIELFDAAPDKITTLAAVLKTTFHQDAVAVAETSEDLVYI